MMKIFISFAFGLAFLFGIYLIFSPTRKDSYPGSCQTKCPEINHGLNCSWNTLEDQTKFKFKNKGFCGDLSERFLIRNSFIGDKALKGDWMMDVKQLNHNEGTQWCRQNIGDDGQKCRYPSITEMVSLLSSNKTKDQGFITEEFINTNQEKFWSQTPLLPARTSGWFIDFNYGTISFMQAKRKLSVRCFCPWEEAKKLK